MPPTAEQVRVSIDALRQDAAMWMGMAEELRAAAQVADRLDLDALHFSYFADLLGISDIYRELKPMMVRHMCDGAGNFDSIAQALRTAADSYEEDERNAVHRLRNIY